MKKFFPTICPECHEPLSIQYGKTDDVTKLVCSNDNCIGTIIKKLQKGIIALEIRGLGPKVIEKLLHAGINHSYDLFDKDIFNEENLIKSGKFKKGRALEKIINSVLSVKQIPIQKAILSLQIDDIGKTFSEKIGMIVSGLNPDLTGLLTSVREELKNKEKGLFKHIKDSIEIFENNGIEITLIEKPKQIVLTEIKKVNKRVSTSDISINEEIESLGWEIVPACDVNVDMHICLDKNNVNPFINTHHIKIMTLKQIKLLFL